MSKPDKRPVHVAEIRKKYKGKVHVSTYLRRALREDGKVKHETVANISDLPDDLLAVIKNRLATGQPLVGDGGTMTIERSLPHGNVAAVLGTMRNIGLDQFIAARPCRVDVQEPCESRACVSKSEVDRSAHSPDSPLER